MNAIETTLNRQIEILTVDMLTHVKEAQKDQNQLHNLITALGYIETLQETIICLKLDIKREIRNRN
jgi:hypothetical protein